jgi:hypothetical protein
MGMNAHVIVFFVGCSHVYQLLDILSKADPPFTHEVQETSQEYAICQNLSAFATPGLCVASAWNQNIISLQ